MIRVLVVDDQQLVRAGLRALCSAQDDVEVVAMAANGAEAVRMATDHVPDVVLMDLHMPGVDGIEATRRILAQRPMPIVALTTFDDDEYLYPALRAGVSGYLLKDTSPERLLDGIRRAAEGESPFDPGVLSRIVRTAGAAKAPATTRDFGLSAREREVFDLLARGLSNAEIAARLHLGVTTVKTHVAGLMAKTGESNRVRLALLAHPPAG
ncbi:DNA-binding response regulator [Lentzea guizhouensis]|uniref:DNA-binding response regulator n=1 Tax=Lentzea guizhouensis TaxID=1586287 RepID=A0A1B2HTU2_9PSEU|nr:response regulator transcription factor [Lentzea guizhouensis]ANZ41105.1 DNA-binding response regulator [Lentzea guizhouensis]